MTSHHVIVRFFRAGDRPVLHAGEPGVAGVEGPEGDGDVQPAPAAGAALAGGGGSWGPGAGQRAAPQ